MCKIYFEEKHFLARHSEPALLKVYVATYLISSLHRISVENVRSRRRIVLLSENLGSAILMAGRRGLPEINVF